MEPVVTLESSASVSAGEGPATDDAVSSATPDSFFQDEATPLLTPPSATHDTRRADFCVKDLDAFARDLQIAADRAFPNEARAKTRYSNVSVLLLRWEEDETNVDLELDDLEKVFKNYGFGTDRWLIPTKNSHLKLMSKVVSVVEEHDGRDELVIVYYVGHAGINASRGATWNCKVDPAYASLEWSAIQTLFEQADFDVLLLLDCCAAASAAPTAASAVTETIAACGFESSAPQSGRHSFTNAVIEVLDDWVESAPFSAAMLHNKVLSILQHGSLETLQNGKRRKLECQRTPIHMVAAADATLPSIELGRRTPKPLQPVSKTFLSTTEQKISQDEIENPPTKTEGTDNSSPSTKLKGYLPELLNDLDGDDYELPRVIISLSLEKHQKLDSAACQTWLASCPTLLRYAKVEAVYNSLFTLMLLSVPVFIWNLLPDNPACSFVGYITSRNVMEPSNSSETKVAEVGSDPASVGTGLPRQTRKACDRCRRQKVKCSGAVGCKLCTLSGSKCVYSEAVERTKSYVDELQKRLKTAESVLKEHGAGPLRDVSAEHVLASHDRTTYPHIVPKPVSLNAQEPGTVNTTSRSGFESSIHTGYKTNAMAYDASLLNKLDGPGGSVGASHADQFSRTEQLDGTSVMKLPPYSKLLDEISGTTDGNRGPRNYEAAPSTKLSDLLQYQLPEHNNGRSNLSTLTSSYLPPLPPPRQLVSAPQDVQYNSIYSQAPGPAVKPYSIATYDLPKNHKPYPEVKYGTTSNSYTDNKDSDVKLLQHFAAQQHPLGNSIQVDGQDKGKNNKYERISSPAGEDSSKRRKLLPEPRHWDSPAKSESPATEERNQKEYETLRQTGYPSESSRDASNAAPPASATSRVGGDTFIRYTGPSQPNGPLERLQSPSPPLTPQSTFSGLPTTLNGIRQPQNFEPHPAQPPLKAVFQPIDTPATARRSSAIPDQDWTYITDIAERRRIQNRIAQRNYRKRLKRRLEDLEERAGSSPSSEGGARLEPHDETRPSHTSVESESSNSPAAPAYFLPPPDFFAKGGQEGGGHGGQGVGEVSGVRNGVEVEDGKGRFVMESGMREGNGGERG